LCNAAFALGVHAVLTPKEKLHTQINALKYAGLSGGEARQLNHDLEHLSEILARIMTKNWNLRNKLDKKSGKMYCKR